MSYKDFLLNVAKVDRGVVPFYQTRTQGEWGVGIDTEPNLDCWAQGMPGFQGMGLELGDGPHMSFTAAGYANGGTYRFHFPDGNASIVRLVVRSLSPTAVSGGDGAEDIVTAKFDYSKLDQPASPVRIRLNSPVMRARHLGSPASAKEVKVVYVNGKQLRSVRARACVMGCSDYGGFATESTSISGARVSYRAEPCRFWVFPAQSGSAMRQEMIPTG